MEAPGLTEESLMKILEQQGMLDMLKVCVMFEHLSCVLVSYFCGMTEEMHLNNLACRKSSAWRKSMLTLRRRER